MGKWRCLDSTQIQPTVNVARFTYEKSGKKPQRAMNSRYSNRGMGKNRFLTRPAARSRCATLRSLDHSAMRKKLQVRIEKLIFPWKKIGMHLID